MDRVGISLLNLYRGRLTLLDIAQDISEGCGPDLRVALQVGREFVQRFWSYGQPIATNAVETINAPMMALDRRLTQVEQSGKALALR